MMRSFGFLHPPLIAVALFVLLKLLLGADQLLFVVVLMSYDSCVVVNVLTVDCCASFFCSPDCVDVTEVCSW